MPASVSRAIVDPTEFTTPSDNAPELTFNAEIKGPGNVIIDHGAGYTTYGSIAFNVDNSYTGTTTISKGRLEITTAGALARPRVAQGGNVIDIDSETERRSFGHAGEPVWRHART